MNLASTFGLSLALALAGCPTPSDDTEETGPVEVIAGPELTHEPVGGPLLAGAAVRLSATATDPDGVRGVVAYHRVAGAPTWETLALSLADGVWSAEIPPAQVAAPGLEYVLKATDDSDFEAARYLPSDGLDAPFQVAVQPVGRALPWGDGFEGGGTSVFARGFFEYSLAYAGLPWSLSTGRPHQGTWSVVHRRGSANVPAMDDWLVSPALDLSGLDHPALRFWEHGEQTGAARHSLWISLTGPDPRQGGFELVQTLAAPVEGAWSQARTVDLSTWAGNRAVHLAWRYEGAYADTWYLDDLQVGEAVAELGLVGHRATPVEPGGEALVEVVLESRSPLPAEGLSVSIEADPALATPGDAAQLASLAPFASAPVTLALQVDASHPLDARLPFTVKVVSEAGESWAFERSLLVGEPAQARVGLELTAPTVVDLRVGRGDPDAPSVSVPVASGTLPAGAHLLEADLLDHVELLPPGPGAERWWLRVDAQGAGRVTSWEIQHRGVRHQSDDLRSFSASIPARFDLPRPPRPTLLEVETDPAPIAPGDRVDVEVRVRNEGLPTVGLTTLRLVSDDPDVEVLDTDPIELAAEGWETSSSRRATFGVRVLPSQTDSQPARLKLRVEDEVESFNLPVQLAVPWPVLQVTGLRVKDRSDGNNNGVLEPDERAQIEVVLANAGGRDSFGQVQCALETTGEGPELQLHVAEASFGRLVVGASRDEDDFEIEVVGGAPGDRLGLELACSDGTASWRVPVGLALGELPWRAAGPIPDPVGDVLGAYPVDLRDIRYRSDGVTLEIELVAAAPFEAGGLFLEAWGSSAGASWSYFQLVSQSGSATLRGYSPITGFTRISSPEITVVDARTVRFTVELADLGLALREIKLGFATGFCGGGTYYCDHYPDAWGDPYQSGFDTSRWLTLSW